MLDFETFVATVIKEKFAELDDTAAAAREQQGIQQMGLGNRVISNTQIETEELPSAETPVSTSTRVLSDMSDPLYYQPAEFPTQEVRVDNAPRFSNINKSTVLDILSANRDGLEKQGIIKMPMRMLRQPDPTLDIDGLQSRILDKLDLRPPEGSVQDIQYGAELQKLGDPPTDEESLDKESVLGPPTTTDVEIGLMSRPVGPKDVGDPLGEGDAIVRAFFQEENDTSITDADGNFSQDALETALKNAVSNPYQQALTLGLIRVEVGDDGPIIENTGYSLNRAYEVYNDASVNAALASLPQAEQNRLKRNRGTPSNALGLAIMDINYDGGSNYRGRGLVQLTHRRNYQAVQDRLAAKGINIDLVGNPDLALDTRYTLPITLAYLEMNGLNSQTASKLSTDTLNDLINPGASAAVAEERWANVVEALEAAGEEEKAREMQLRNEYQAQRTVQTVVDGKIGVNSYDAIQRWAGERNLTVPEVTPITKTYRGGERAGETYQSFSDEDKIKLAIFVNENT